MAEVVGIVTGVIALLPLCSDGCYLIENIIKADRRVEEQLVRIQIQRDDLKGWGMVWEIPAIAPKQGVDFKLQRWVQRNKEMGSSVLRTLAAISNLFADSSSLQRKYGVHMKRRDPDLQDITADAILGDPSNVAQIKRRVETRRQHMAILKRCRFELRGASQFDGLVERLREFIGVLRNICSDAQAAQIDRVLPGHISNNQSPGSLEVVSRVYDSEVVRRREAGQESESMALIRDIAAFKARVVQLARKRQTLFNERRRSFLLSGRYLDQGDFTVETHRPETKQLGVLLAIDKRTKKACYIEWKRYAEIRYSKQGVVTHKEVHERAENDIMALSDFFGVENRPRAFRVLKLLGIFRDEANARFGFVYQPSRHIENLEGHKTLDKEFSRLRKPTTLQSEMISGFPTQLRSMLSLGDRYQLARNVAQCLYVLHATGWVHKNIRASSIMFLPQESRSGGTPSRGESKDLSRPYLSGFGHSRMDELELDEDPTTLSYGRQERTSMRWNISLDYNHHPRKRDNSDIVYTSACDVYSLGVVLLQIGVWQSLNTYNMPKDSNDARNEIISRAKRSLPGYAGKTYTDVVLTCLQVKGNETINEMQQLLLWKVLAPLDDCKA